VRVIVNDSCQGCGVCEAQAPAVFAVQDDGTAAVVLNPVPEEHREAVRKAAYGCPTESVEIIG
jgi:ferredoxin